ncbi:MAG: glycosyltransferase family 2 protein [Verrucomicrobia bacterium]|nr:glycosyltransferase family 2 protein [Verrucomicrobiota bacterium]
MSLVLLAYTYPGYPLLMAALAKLRGRKPSKAPLTPPPLVSVVLVAFNEEQRIAQRLQNLLASDWPAEKLEIIVVSDGSIDATVARVKELNETRVRVIERRERAGKAACVNVGVADARGEIVVFCDARQRFAPETIRELVSNFADPHVGAASGELFVDPAASSVGGGVDAYWKLEKFIRAAESRWHSCIGCTGAVYAVRRALFEPVPDDTLLDDVVVPMQITARGHRVLYDTSAPAFDPQPLEPSRERTRKQRTLAGNFQMIFRYPDWMLPGAHGLWWQLISHKYLRIAAPLFMASLFVSNCFLRADGLFYAAFFWGQCAFYGLAAMGMMFPRVRTPVLSLPAGFVFLHFMVVGGFWNYLRGTYRRGAW